MILFVQCDREDIFETAKKSDQVDQTEEDGSETDGDTGTVTTAAIIIDGIPTGPAGENTTTEFEDTVIINVKLSMAPSSDVMIMAMSNDMNEGFVDGPSSYIFTTANWETPQAIAVKGVNDSVYDKEKNYNVSLTATSTDTDFEGLSKTVSLVNKSNDRWIFLTTGTTIGNFGGIAGADAFCNGDGGRPDPGLEYRAFIVDGVNRVASVTGNTGDGQVDWVLIPDGEYYKDTSTSVGSTGPNALLIFDLYTPISAGGFAWTGLETDWTTSAFTCDGWVSTPATGGMRGNAGVLTTAMLGTASTGYTAASFIICVEKP